MNLIIYFNFIFLEISPEKYLIIGAYNVLMVVHHQIIGGHGIDKSTLADMHIDNLIHDYAQGELFCFFEIQVTIRVN